MIKIDFSKQFLTFLKKIPRKDAQLLGEKISILRNNPSDILSKPLQGHKPLRRIRAGGYRIVYFIEQETLFISFVGKRNDDEVYRKIPGKGKTKMKVEYGEEKYG
ncbi:type II toxin-antitoxin system RelE/ParE family toxin [Candidatus Gracilibacteria bacterium]|nr:type II toxin-antitoxin system RelE/ParE family toxin [Candidatus Gracilibacteria bacterium]